MRQILMLLLSTAAYGQAFGMLDVVAGLKGCGASCTLTINLSGTPPYSAGQQQYWSVAAVDPTTKTVMVVGLNGPPQISSNTINNVTVSFATLPFNEASLMGADPRKVTWRVSFADGTTLVVKEGTSVTGVAGWFSKAKDRNEADLYFSGSVLAGQGTKPIYIVDAKINLFYPLPSLLRAGVTSDILINPESKPPQERSEIDPDSIKAAGALDGLKTLDGTFNALLWQWRPIGGEFARSYPASNVMTEGRLGVSLKSVPWMGGWLNFYPYAGYEIGQNTNKPSSLFKRPVDLSLYDDIRRVLLLGDAGYRVFGTEETAKLQITASYQGRILFADEPMTRLEYLFNAEGVPELDDKGRHKRDKVVRMQRNMRHFVRIDASWNVSPYFGLTLGYKYGSLPPLFEFTRNQVTFGLSFKTKLFNKRP